MINSYYYTLIYFSGRLHGNADAFSRLPPPNIISEEYPGPAKIQLMELKDQPVSQNNF